MGKLLHYSKPQFSHLKMEIEMISIHAYWKNSVNQVSQVLREIDNH